MEHVQPLLRFVGFLLQLAGALLLAGLFLLLRPYAHRRRYFQVWAAAWFTLAAALTALVVRYLVAPGFSPLADWQATSAPVQALLYGYQLGKLSFLALLVAGTGAYVIGAALTPFLPVAVGLFAAYALVSLYASPDLLSLLLWQSPVAAISLGWCGVRMSTLPRSRQAIGPRITAMIFLLMATLSGVYTFAFGAAVPDAAGRQQLYDALVRFNPYIDVLLFALLGCGMVVIMMEDAKREVDDAHAELAVAHNELRRAALYDTLTGALNRRAFVEGVGLDAAKGQFGCVIMVDLDDLKGLNDLHGHSAGDAMLRHLAEALRTELRPYDKVYRWGGDEFLLVLPGAEEVRAHARLRGVIAAAASLQLGGNEEVRLSVSMGSASYASAEQLLGAIDRADAAMYEEKNRRKQLRGSGTPAA